LGFGDDTGEGWGSYPAGKIYQPNDGRLKTEKVMQNEKELAEGVVGVTLVWLTIALIGGAVLSGCSFKVETLYHGQTPIGLDHRQATSLQSGPPAKVIKYRED
jgi:hypothetical protein